MLVGLAVHGDQPSATWPARTPGTDAAADVRASDPGPRRTRVRASSSAPSSRSAPASSTSGRDRRAARRRRTGPRPGPGPCRRDERRCRRGRRAAARAPVTTMVLPAPVSPVTTVRPGPSSSDGVVDDAEATAAASPPAQRRLAQVASAVVRSRAAPAVHRQAELRHQPVGERRRVQPGQPHGRARRGEPRPALRAAGRGAPAVAPQHRRTAQSAASTSPRAPSRRHHQRPGEQRVRADRHQQQRRDLRPDHRPAGTERVRRRAGRRRADHPVAAPAGQRPPVDLDHDLEHPLRAGLLDAGLVQRPVAVRPPRRRRGPDVEGQPLLDLVSAADDLVDGGVEVVALGLGEEADVPEVDAQQRRPGSAGPARRRAGSCRRRRGRRRARSRRPRRSPAGTTVGSRRRRRQVVGLRPSRRSRDPGRGQPGTAAGLPAGALRRPVCATSSTAPCAPACGGSGRRSPSHRRARPRPPVDASAGRRRRRPGAATEVLHVARRSRQRAGRDARGAQPESSAPPRHLEHGRGAQLRGRAPPRPRRAAPGRPRTAA